MLNTNIERIKLRLLLIIAISTASFCSPVNSADNSNVSNAKNIVSTTHYICGNVEKLVCLHKTDATQNWVSELNNTSSIITTSSDNIIFSSSNGLFSFSAAGKSNWKNTDFSNLFAPIKRGDQIWAGSNKHGVLSYHAETGKLLWQYKLPTWVYTPAIVDNSALIVGNDATLYAVDSLTGKKQWQTALPQEPVMPPIASHHGMLISLFDASIAHYSASDGKLLWSFDTQGIVTDMLLDKETLFISDRSGNITAINIITGNQDWQQTTDIPMNYTLSQDDNNLYLSDQQKNIIVANKKTGQLHSTFSVDTTPLTPVIRIENSVYVMTNPRKPFNNFVLTKLH